MLVTIVTKSGTCQVDTDEPTKDTYTAKSPLYRAVRAYFDNWINNQDNETKSFYFGSFEELNGQSYADCNGAIIDGIDNVLDYCKELNLTRITTKEFYKIDFEGIFQM